MKNFNNIVYVNGTSYAFASKKEADRYAKACEKGGAYVWQTVR